jgi:hypothetical protein
MNWTRTAKNAVILLWIATVLWIAQELGMLASAWKEFGR